MDELIVPTLSLFNEILASGIVIFAASILLYNLTRNLRDRVTRSSGVVLACVTGAYICDVFLSLGPGAGTFANTLRLQWLAIAFMPAALFHLSDALLATTGLPSRGRRRRLIRVLYGFSIAFVLLATFTDVLVTPLRVQPPLLGIRRLHQFTRKHPVSGLHLIFRFGDAVRLLQCSACTSALSHARYTPSYGLLADCNAHACHRHFPVFDTAWCG